MSCRASIHAVGLGWAFRASFSWRLIVVTGMASGNLVKVCLEVMVCGSTLHIPREFFTASFDPSLSLRPICSNHPPSPIQLCLLPGRIPPPPPPPPHNGPRLVVKSTDKHFIVGHKDTISVDRLKPALMMTH